MDNSTEHIPVLAKTLAERISLPQEAVMVDATIGHGGHSLLLGSLLGPEGMIIGLDIDRNSIQRAHLKLKDLACKVSIVNENFSHIEEVVENAGVGKVDLILADLGICSAQLTDIDMGLSFQENMPLDMRLDKRLKTTAADIINRTDEKSLADLIYKYGEDRASRRIARFIVEYRSRQKITTTDQLCSIVCKALGQKQHGWRKSKSHPATKTFQALRIAVNDELENLEKLLKSAPGLLKQDGLIAIISFHSLEDRIVKNDFKANKQEQIYEVLTKKPLVPDRAEIVYNPRARSSKLRISRKL